MVEEILEVEALHFIVGLALHVVQLLGALVVPEGYDGQGLGLTHEKGGEGRASVLSGKGCGC